MAKGILNIQAADGAVIGLHVPDGLTSGERPISLGVNLSGITAYHLLQGNLAVSTSTITQGFSTTLYTGNGGTQSITTGIDMNTQWGSTAEEKFGGLVWIKNRTTAGTSNMLSDTVRGTLHRIITNSTVADTTDTGNTVTAFNSNGFSVGVGLDVNPSGTANNQVSWNFQTTHRTSGVTNHGKPYTCHYNPYTGFTIVKYEGSGLAGHEIPHHLGRKLGFIAVKNLSVAQDWLVTSNSFIGNNNLYFNKSDAIIGNWPQPQFDNYHRTITGSALENASANDFILYGWANSYLDEANKLIGNYEIGVYQGTGATGNKITTRGKPAWIMVKRLDSISDWWIMDNQRANDGYLLYPNYSNAEYVATDFCDFLNDGFKWNNSNGSSNASGGQYLYLVAYDTNSNGGGSYYPLASDTANVQVNNALIPIAQGIDSNGAKNTILSKNETFSGVTYTQGKNYPYYDALGNRGVSNKAPNYGLTNPANGGDFYNVLSNKWFTSAGTEIVNGRNYLNHIVYADNDGGVLYVEELPKIEYKDIVKANEFKGKNACTAWVNFDLSTTPPTIRDSYNVSAVVRTATGVGEMYFSLPTDTKNYSVCISGNVTWSSFGIDYINSSINKIKFWMYDNSTYVTNNNYSFVSIQVFGGKN